MAGIVIAAAGAARRPERASREWLAAVEARAMGSSRTACSREEQGDEFLLMGLRLAEGIEPRRFEAISGRVLDPRRLAALIGDDMVEMHPRAASGSAPRAFPCSTPWSPISPPEARAIPAQAKALNIAAAWMRHMGATFADLD